MKQLKLFLFLAVFSGLLAQDKPEEGKNQKSKKEEKLKITGRVQFRGVSGEKHTIYNNGHKDFNSLDWNFRRLRLGAIYESGYFGAVIDIKLENLMNKNYTTYSTEKDPVSGKTYVTKVKDHDNKGGVQEANVWINIPFLKSRITFGQFKVPFMREQLESSSRLLFTEREMVAQAMTQWEIGAKYSFKPLLLLGNKYENYMSVDLSVTNGHGSSHEGTGAKQSLTETKDGPFLISPLYNWRVEINPFGGLLKGGKDKGWTEGDEVFQRETKLSIGIAGAMIKELYVSGTHNTYTKGVSKVDILNVQKTPTNGDGISYDITADQTGPGRPRLGLVGRTYDFSFTSHGAYLNGSYTKYIGSASNNLRGYQGTVGYIIPIKNRFVMPVLRYDYMAGDFNHNGNIGDEEVFRNIWAGVNIFMKKHDLKFQVMYQIQRDKLGTDPRTNRANDLKNNLFYFQVQSSFSTGVMLDKG